MQTDKKYQQFPKESNCKENNDGDFLNIQPEQSLEIFDSKFVEKFFSKYPQYKQYE